MGTIGKKIRIEEAKFEFNKLKDLLIPIHCECDIDNITISGSIRRSKEVDIGDIDVVLTTLDGNINPNLSAYLIKSGYYIDANGPKLIRMLSKEGIQIDIYSVDESHFPCMMAYLTGPADFNIGMRVVAKRKGMRLNQNSLTKYDSGEEIYLKSEEDLFNKLGCKYIEPNNRINFYDSLKFNKL